MMKHLTQAAALSALLLGSGVSRATVVPLPPPSVLDMMKVPEHAPTHVNGGARVGGIFVGLDPSTARERDFWQYQVFTTAGEAAEFSARGYVDPGRKKPSPCVFVSDDRAETGEAWTAMATLGVRRASSASTPVLGIHLETLLGDGTPGHPASLDVVDAWFDTRTRGLKLVSRSKLELTPVAEGPLRVRVLAARDANSVHLVVLPPPNPEGPLGGFFERALIQSRGEVGMSECRHSRVTLDAQAGTGENADIVFQQGVPMPPEPGDAFTDFGAPTELRVLRVHLSASRNTGASEPIVSVSFHADPLKSLG